MKPMIHAAALAAMTAAGLSAAPAADDDRAAVEAFYSRLLSDAGATTAASVRTVVAENWQSTPQPLGGPGADGLVETLKAFSAIVPDLRWTPEEILRDGNRFIVRGRATGTPAAPFLGVDPPTGRSFDIMSIDIHTVEDGRITRSYHVEDWATAIAQLTGG